MFTSPEAGRSTIDDDVSPDRRLAFGVAIAYVVLGGIWIVVSDLGVHRLLGTSVQVAQTVKGLAFIGASALLVLWLALRVVHTTQMRLQLDRSRFSRQLVNNILGSLGEAVFIVDPATRAIVHCNSAAEEMFGYSRGELLGQSTEILHVDRESYEEFGRQGEPFLERGKPFRTEYSLRKKDGTVMHTENTVTALEEEAGWRAGVVSVIRDVSERRRLEEQIRQAQKMESVGRLAGGIAHDFNNLLSVILGGAEIAMATLPDSHVAQEDLREIYQAGERAARLTRQLLAFARKQEISPVVLDLNEAVGGMTNMLKRLVPEDMQLSWRPGDDLPNLRMDPGQIDQILANLVVNARDAIGEGPGHVDILTARRHLDRAFCEDHVGCTPGDYLLLQVRDDGEGMDEETLARAFEPFFTTKATGRGTGLGLATVYGIVKQNEGYLDLSSTLGEGTTVSIYLPAATEDVSPTPSTLRQTAQPVERESAATILLVEDEPALLLLLTRLLERMGHRVLAASNATEAVRQLSERGNDIDLLVTDVVMPGQTGRELYETLSKSRPGLKCLFMSGYSQDVVAHRGVVGSDVHLLAKPFTSDAMARKIREVLDAE